MKPGVSSWDIQMEGLRQSARSGCPSCALLDSTISTVVYLKDRSKQLDFNFNIPLYHFIEGVSAGNRVPELSISSIYPGDSSMMRIELSALEGS